MKDMGIVRGSKAQAVPFVVSVDTVYVHTDIKKVDSSIELQESTSQDVYDNLYEYHEIQYTIAEYTELMMKNIQTEGIAMANLKLSDMQKSMMIENLGKALAQARLDIMQLKAKS